MRATLNKNSFCFQCFSIFSNLNRRFSLCFLFFGLELELRRPVCSGLELQTKIFLFPFCLCSRTRDVSFLLFFCSRTQDNFFGHEIETCLLFWSCTQDKFISLSFFFLSFSGLELKTTFFFKNGLFQGLFFFNLFLFSRRSFINLSKGLYITCSHLGVKIPQ